MSVASLASVRFVSRRCLTRRVGKIGVDRVRTPQTSFAVVEDFLLPRRQIASAVSALYLVPSCLVHSFLELVRVKMGGG